MNAEWLNDARDWFAKQRSLRTFLAVALGCWAASIWFNVLVALEVSRDVGAMCQLARGPNANDCTLGGVIVQLMSETWSAIRQPSNSSAIPALRVAFKDILRVAALLGFSDEEPLSTSK